MVLLQECCRRTSLPTSSLCVSDISFWRTNIRHKLKSKGIGVNVPAFVVSSLSHLSAAVLYFQSGIQRLKDYPQPFWLALFVEGTRFTQAKLLAAQEYAASTGLPVPRNVLIPRTKVKFLVHFEKTVVTILFGMHLPFHGWFM